MAAKTNRLEARVSPEQRAMLERAASMAGTSLSAFVIDAAMERAEEIAAAQLATTVPAGYFDHVVTELDRADSAPNLMRAGRRARKRSRIGGR